MNLVSLWPKLFAIIFLLFFFISLARIKLTRSLSIFSYIIAVLLLRDLLYAFFQQGAIIALSDLIVISLYLLWLRSYTGAQLIDRFYIVVNALVLGAGISNLFFGFVPQSEFYLNLWVIVEVIYLAVFLGMVSPYATEKAGIIFQTRFAIITVFFLTNLITLLFGYGQEFIQSILLPLSYLIHAYVLLRHNRDFHHDAQQSIDSYSTNLEAMFDFMGNLGSAITAKIDLPKVLEIIISSAVHNVGADAGAILMVDEFEDVLRVRATYGVHPPLYPIPKIAQIKTSSQKRYFAEKPIKIGETILGEVVQTGQPILIKDARQDERLRYNTENDFLFVSSIMLIPLVVSNRVLGVLSTLKRAENQFFDEQDFNHLKTFAEYASLTIDNIYTYMEALEKREMEREVNIAAEIQQKLLPGRLPELQGVSLATFSLPAKGVSGDYYDIIPLDHQKVAMVIGDVAGKGVPAALVMVMIRSILHLIVSAEREAATILTWINRGITGRIELDHYATLGFLTFDQKSQLVTFSNAAHHPLLLYKNKTGKLHEIDTLGLPIGIEISSKYGQKKFALEKGDMIILYTDGIIEAMNEAGEQYSFTSLKKLIEKNSKLSASKLVELIRSDVKRFAGNARQHDDQTLMLLKVNN